MSRPTKSLRMARTAKAAMLAAVEVYNKTTFSYREETFCLLIVNAWELLLKARVLHENENDLAAISRGSDRRSDADGDERTIGLFDALGMIDVRNDVRENIRGLARLRNEVQHIGAVEPAFKQEVLRFGTAAVQNMVQALHDWFNEPTENMYLFPMAFIGATTAVQASSARQRQLLKQLDEIASRSDGVDDGYHVAAAIRVDMHASGSGGGTIAPTNDPSAPRVHLSDDELVERYPVTYYDGLIPALRSRYSDFSQNRVFNDLMRKVKEDAGCMFERPLDPKKPQGTRQARYNLEAVYRHLDQHYTLR